MICGKTLGTLSNESEVDAPLVALPSVPEEESGNFRTVRGVVMRRHGNVPELADCFEFSVLRFEAVEMERSRVGKVLFPPGYSS